jgi:hypothetical protein
MVSLSTYQLHSSSKCHLLTQSIGSPAGFMIVALNGLWVCKNCLVIVDNSVRSSSARLYISFHSTSRRGEDVQSNEMTFWGVDRISISLFVLPSASSTVSGETGHTPIKILSISICLPSATITSPMSQYSPNNNKTVIRQQIPNSMSIIQYPLRVGRDMNRYSTSYTGIIRSCIFYWELATHPMTRDGDWSTNPSSSNMTLWN